MTLASIRLLRRHTFEVQCNTNAAGLQKRGRRGGRALNAARDL